LTFLSSSSTSAPVWAPSCAGAAAPPAFARFHADVPLGPQRSVLSALLYVTGSPPIYQDPWTVTKLLGGYKLAVNGSTLGVGPGRTSCGPLRPGSQHGGSTAGLCSPVQPVDGYDVRAQVAAALAAGAPLALDIASYGLVQQSYGLVPAVQAALHVRWAPEGSAPDLVVGTAAGAPWLALDADSLVRPSGNKAPFWYTQPREDVNASCLPALPGSGKQQRAAPAPPSSCSACGWTTPAPAPSAWLAGAVPLAGKTTQALSFTRAAPRAEATAQLGPGWYVLDSGREFQGGVRLQLLPGAPKAARCECGASYRGLRPPLPLPTHLSPQQYLSPLTTLPLTTPTLTLPTLIPTPTLAPIRSRSSCSSCCPASPWPPTVSRKCSPLS
jgi:hypothetical protein